MDHNNTSMSNSSRFQTGHNYTHGNVVQFALQLKDLPTDTILDMITAATQELKLRQENIPKPDILDI